MDCPTITVLAGKCYKALIDSGAALSLIRYSTHQIINSSFKTPIEATTAKFNMADGSLMMALGITVLHLSDAWDKEKNCNIQKNGRFLTYTRNYKQKATIGILKSTLKIPPRHHGIVPIKIKGHTIKGHMAYFISYQDLRKRKESQFKYYKWHKQHQRKNISEYPHVRLYQ